ncbi:sulfite exporter TauE/SafE family protein [SAR202 cluster bacterium AD-804-J14_MRT_500m]|nr:sulfite exporter TauE/SafE family protein [SAR202 cluster bacterium AD-804-J14_MRT_500m]
MQDLTPWLIFAFLALGLGAGTYGVLIGAAGGFIVAPLLIVAFGVDHEVAVGTSLVTVFFASSSGAISFVRLRQIDVRATILFTIVSVPGAILGIAGLGYVPPSLFHIFYGLILAALGTYVLLRPPVTYDALHSESSVTSKYPSDSWWHKTTNRTSTVTTASNNTYKFTYNEPMAIITNGIFGFSAGFLGMGGGPIRTPALMYLFHFPLTIAIGTSVTSQVLLSAIGSAVHVWDNNVDIPSALLIGGGMVIGAQIAVRASKLIRPTGLMRLLSIALIGIGCQLIFSGAAL